MKTHALKLICLGLFTLLSSVLLANELFAYGAETNKLSEGFWVIETQPNNKEAIVRYYTKERHLVHIEKVPAKEVNLKKNGTAQRLNSKAAIFAGMYKRLAEQQKVQSEK